MQRGFTVIEIVTVLALATFISGFFLLVGMDSFRANAFHSDRSVLIAALFRARAQALNNVCLGAGCTDGRAHGVKIFPDSYVIFQGGSYATRDIAVDHVIESSPLITQGGVAEIVFAQLTGAVASPGDITLGDASGRTSTISINTEGRVTWTN